MRRPGISLITVGKTDHGYSIDELSLETLLHAIKGQRFDARFRHNGPIIGFFSEFFRDNDKIRGTFTGDFDIGQLVISLDFEGACQFADGRFWTKGKRSPVNSFIRVKKVYSIDFVPSGSANSDLY